MKKFKRNENENPLQLKGGGTGCPPKEDGGGGIRLGTVNIGSGGNGAEMLRTIQPQWQGEIGVLEGGKIVIEVLFEDEDPSLSESFRLQSVQLWTQDEKLHTAEGIQIHGNTITIEFVTLGYARNLWLAVIGTIFLPKQGAYEICGTLEGLAIRGPSD